MRSGVAAPGWNPGGVIAHVAGWVSLASARAYGGQRAEGPPGEQPRSSADETATSDGAPPAPVPAAAFEPFFREHERAVYACLWRLTGDAQAARDLTQETFLRAWRHFEQRADI